MASAEAHANVTQLMKHVEQVEAGLIPEDSPPLFTVPQPLDAKGLPWWFGPDYKPTAEAMESFEKPLPTADGGSA